MTDRCDLCAMYMATDGDACARCRKQRRRRKKHYFNEGGIPDEFIRDQQSDHGGFWSGS